MPELVDVPKPAALAVWDLARSGLTVSRICAHAGLTPFEVADALTQVARWRSLFLEGERRARPAVAEVCSEAQELITWALVDGNQRAATLAQRVQVLLGELSGIRAAASARARSGATARAG
jgi:hypothetical protein